MYKQTYVETVLSQAIEISTPLLIFTVPKYVYYVRHGNEQPYSVFPLYLDTYGSFISEVGKINEVLDPVYTRRISYSSLKVYKNNSLKNKVTKPRTNYRLLFIKIPFQNILILFWFCLFNLDRSTHLFGQPKC